MKRKAAAIKIQAYTRGRLARKCYSEMKASIVVLQSGFQAMAARRARDKFRHIRQTRSSTIIQVRSMSL